MSPKDSDDRQDAMLFHRAAGKVRRIETDRVSHEPGRPRPLPRERSEAETSVADMMPDSPFGNSTQGALFFTRPGVQRKVIRKLRRGQFRIEDQLDLHGMTVSKAADALAAFLGECAKRQRRCVCIIHGKGLGSSGRRAVIKQSVDRWLRLRNEVVAFCSAQPGDGGTGAIYVLLKRRPPHPPHPPHPPT
jgi:DNA-nicking Smr family endonuclease